ncbi:hypothetical protein SLA2020_450060 [Shorea laevis]
MEDCNMLVADCVVICCCCQCLILQIIFFFLRLPCKLILKTKEFAKKLRSRRKMGMTIESVKGGYRFQEEFVELHRRSISIQIIEAFPVEGVQGYQCCMEEVQKVFDELSLRGEFAFGSFWRREGSSGSSVQEIDIDSINFVHYELIELDSSCKTN